MNYNGNMPDWHQYNPPQSGINDVTSAGQNINSGHFISSISPTCPPQLSSLNLSSEGLEKHQNDSNFNPRHFQPHLPANIPHGHNAVADNTPLASMAQMQNCIGHYGPSNTRNAMVDNLNGPMDPRGAAISGPLNEDLGYRNNQVPLNGPISHHGHANVMNMNAPHGPIAPRSTNVNAHAASRTGPPPPSFAPCKALCCNPDPSMGYQQYCSYQNNAAYRENIRSSAGYQADARRFNNDYNFRKDNFDGKDVPPPPPPSMVPPHNVPNVDHRRNFSDPMKYRKDRLVSRGYPPASSMLHNYSMQNYNYAEYQKYPYGVKDYSKVGGMNMPGQGMGVKQHGQEQGFAMPQQKYNSSKQVPPYQSNGGMMPSGMPSAPNVPPNPAMMNPAAQNTYYNSQYQRNLSTETSHGCGAPQETADNVQAMQANRIQTSTMPHTTPPHSRYQEFHQKLTMHRFSIENHLRKLSRMPDYQNNPEYKDYVHKYNEIVNLERHQSFAYQGQMQQQQQQQQAAPCVAVNPPPTVPSINLQFDRNGVLINSNYLPEAFSRVQQVVNPPQAPVDNGAADKQGKQNGKGVVEMASHSTVQKPEQMLSAQQHVAHPAAGVLCPEGIQQGKQDQYPAPKSLDHQRQFEVPKAPGEGYSNLSANDATAMQQKMQPKVLDVRQFLANWDESEDEDGTSAGNLPEAVLSNSTPVVVVGYENVNLSAKALEGLNTTKPQEIAPGVIAFENHHPSKSDGVVAAQDCLTISYTENAKDSACKELTKVRSGSHIIQCISNEPGEAPTIHIVDNLEISSILQVANGQVATETPDAVSFFQEGTEIEASSISLEADKFKKADGGGGESSATALPDLTSKEKYIEDSSSSKATETAAASQPAQVTDQLKDNNLDAAQDTNLKKQSSFASEESHNPDDISLPDLPTSECTPISTTLNTPIHSDNEESSEHVVEDLTIPTNPIEIIQNSPMISFTQSPTKGEPYDHLSDEGADGRRSTDSPGGQYRTEARFKSDGSGDTLDHDTVLGTFEFTENIDKSETTAMARSNKERVSSHGNCTTTNNNEKTFALDGETESVAEVTGMRMTLTSGEYELKIVSTGASSKPPRDYKNATIERHVNESQAAAVSQDASSMTRKKLPLLPETCAKVAPGHRYGDSELNNALQNIAKDPLECSRNDVNCVERRCVPTELTDQAGGANAASSTGDATSRNSRPEDVSSTRTHAKSSNPSHSAKHSNLSGGDKSRRCDSDKFTRENPSSEKRNTDVKDLKSFRHVKRTDHHHRKSASGDPSAISHKKRCLSESTAERGSGEATTHHDKHTQEADAHKAKSSESSKESPSSDVSRSKPKIIENVRISDSSERMRLLKEYRRIKYKSCNVGESGKNAQEAFDCAASKKTAHLVVPSSPDERSSNDKQLCQRDAAMLKLSDEQEKRANILRSFVAKNINPDIDIQVTNVNLKLNDNDHQRDHPQCSREDGAKNGGALDAIKIEINVSCSERNTTKTLLHEDIKNAVAETIGHLTSTISSGARSSSTSITEIQCDKGERCDYERSPAYDNEAYKDQDNNGEAVKQKSAIGERGAANEETSNPLVSKKRRNSSLERDQIDNTYDDNDNVNVETETASSTLETSKTEHAVSNNRRRSVQQDAERKVAAANFCASNEESKILDNSSYVGSKNTQKKDHQEMTATSLSRSARNSQDDVAPKSSNATSSVSSSAANSSLEDNARYDNPAHFDYNHFDVAPNEHTDANDSDKRSDRWKRPKRDDGRFGSFESACGFINPSFFSADERENLNVVPVYTTKDGRITYSPNPRFTYRELIMEARAKESYGSSGVRDSYFARSPSYDYYNCSKLRKVFKRHRDVASRKRDVDSADGKPAAKHNIDYSPSRSAAKTRDTSHLEFFNDEANKLFANSRNGQQEGKEGGRKNIVDLSFLEKKYTNESVSGVKHCKTKALADELNYEKNYSEGSVFDANLFLGPRSTCEETMESIKSYSSHIDRRNMDGLKELSFSEIFSAQKRLDSFPFLPVEQNFSDNERKANCDTVNEPVLHNRAICSFIDDAHTVRDGDARCEKSNALLCNEQGNEISNRNDAVDVNDKSMNTPDESLNVQRNDEHLTKQESQSGEIESGASVPAETPRSCSPKVADEKIHDSERDQCPASDAKDNEALVEHPASICNADASKEDKSNAEEIEIAENVENTENAESVENTENVKNIENVENAENVEDSENIKNAENVENAENAEHFESVGNAGNAESAEKPEETEQAGKSEDSRQDGHLEVANPPEQNEVVKYSPDELKFAETIGESAHSSNVQEDDGINEDCARTASDSAVDQEILTARQVSPVLNEHKEQQEVALATESDLPIETDQTRRANEQDDACDDGNSAVCQEKESITPQNPSNVNFTEQTELDEVVNERELQRPEDEEERTEISLKDPEIDEVDHCNSMIVQPPVLDLQMARPDESVCDLFANEKREQNISEFTVIKSIIKPDGKQAQEPEVKEHLKDCDSIIDTKLLCMDSSDCGIYTEDRCTLAQISEHDFTEEDSMVPMEWETSQIQEDAVNRLCSIDESSIDFAGAAGSLQDNSLLNNLSLSRASSSAIKEFAVPEKIMDSESRTNDESAVAVESTPMTIEESKPNDNNNDDDDDDNVGKEPDQVSSSSYEKVAYLRATDCNANTKIVPKLVIKKSEASSKSFITKLSASASSVPSANSKPSYQPKIPKMIIRNARSRPGTPSIPSIEAVHEEAPAQANVSERASSLARDELYDNDSNQSSLHDSSQGHRNKIPKMKIKLDERHSSKIITAEDGTEICARRRNLKKSSSKESRRSSSRDPDRHEERIPVLKLRKAERNRSSSPEGVARKRHSSSHSDVPLKKCKRSGRGDEGGHSTTRRSSSSDSARTTASECEMRRNHAVCISEKIPKVIIKRTSASAEFKCEFSKGCKSAIAKSAKWQPEVKLERYRILDSMVRDLKLTLSPISLCTVEKIFASGGSIRRQQEGDHKLARSNSTSDLLPAKFKQRRMSDYDCRKAGDALNSGLSFARDADVKGTTCTTPKRNVSSKSHGRPIDGGPKDDRRRSRSRDNSNLQEMDTDITDKETNQSSGGSGTALPQNDERKIGDLDVHHERAVQVEDRKEDTPVKCPSNSTDFRVALKELKETSKTEDCFAKLPDLSEPPPAEIDSRTVEKERQRDEQDDELFYGENDGKILIKKERLSSSNDLDCPLQDDIGLSKDDSADMLNSFGADRSSIIKVESSDDSQSTIEILPASPDNIELENNIIEDGDSEQLYSADAIPTQFELELEIADNSNMDLLDMNMPKLDPVSGYSSCRFSTEESCGDQASTAGLCNKPESSSRDRNPQEKDKHAVASDVFAPESNSAGSTRSPCHRTAGSVATREYFCCSDSLIKEVLAAKETLKKCLSKSRCEESGARLKTVAEKKQGSSFDLSSLSETRSKSGDATQGACRSDVGAPQAAFAPAAGRHKTDSTPDVEKLDKKHSKQSKSSCAKKKSKSPETNGDRANAREVTRSALESATISLKTFRRVGQAASNESRTVYLSEKRKNSADHQSDVPQSQRKEGSKWSSYKIPKISKSTDRSRAADGSNARNSKPREDNMPVLEPAIPMDLDSDRDSSRSPPVITVQDGEDVEITEAKLADDKIITSTDTKDVHKKSEMSTIDFISQLAYHEKATIKHRRYCNLCERWFPTTARHRRHLAGYQHRHIELTQRRSIHALFMLFTGKPCPWLKPAHLVRNDCHVGELTPLQIAVQDVTKCFDTQQNPKKQNDVDK